MFISPTKPSFSKFTISDIVICSDRPKFSLKIGFVVKFIRVSWGVLEMLLVLRHHHHLPVFSCYMGNGHTCVVTCMRFFVQRERKEVAAPYCYNYNHQRPTIPDQLCKPYRHGWRTHKLHTIVRRLIMSSLLTTSFGYILATAQCSFALARTYIAH
jgi:hypothetical protein